MSAIEETLREVASAATWDQRVQAVRRVPERHGLREHQEVYAAIARELYRPHLSPLFMFVPWRPEYERDTFARAYRRASELTQGFGKVDVPSLAEVLQQAPEALLVFRVIVGYTPSELAGAVAKVAAREAVRPVSESRLKGAEVGRRLSPAAALLCAQTIDLLVRGELWEVAPAGSRSKQEKLDTAQGWGSVKELAASGVPYDAYLHQRHFGGAFRQLLDATGQRRGEVLELPITALLADKGVPFVRTGAAQQSEIAGRFNITVRPAPDFVVFEPPDVPRALIECKQANDGGTARDKASRFRALRREAERLGGVPVFAVLDGLGWERVNDALGPVIRDCDGRVFTLQTLPEMLEVQPFPALVGKSGT